MDISFIDNFITKQEKKDFIEAENVLKKDEYAAIPLYLHKIGMLKNKYFHFYSQVELKLKILEAKYDPDIRKNLIKLYGKKISEKSVDRTLYNYNDIKYLKEELNKFQIVFSCFNTLYDSLKTLSYSK